MLSLPSRYNDAVLLFSDRGKSFAGRSARIARRSRAIAIARAAETQIPAELRPRETDRFVVGVHFDGDEDSLYQLTQWLAPLEGLAAGLRADLGVDQPLGILCRSADHALHMAESTSLPVRFARLAEGLRTFMEQPQLRVVLYVNQAMKNFQALRFAGPAHVHLSHGESEKASMISNQLKAYDWVFTGGAAARERIRAALIGMPESRMIDVGRPQLDDERSLPTDWTGSTLAALPGPLAFFAPTWEGDSPAMAYGTVAQTGLEILTSLVAAGFRVIYRPHPRTGSVTREARRAREACERFARAHRRCFLDETPGVGWQFDVADASVAEMSSVAFDWLTTGRPLVMVRPSDARAEVLAGGLFDRAVSVLPGEARSVGGLLRDALAHPETSRVQAAELAQHYLGATGVGEQQTRFVDAVRLAIRLRSAGEA